MSFADDQPFECFTCGDVTDETQLLEAVKFVDSMKRPVYYAKCTNCGSWSCFNRGHR